MKVLVGSFNLEKALVGAFSICDCENRWIVCSSYFDAVLYLFLLLPLRSPVHVFAYRTHAHNLGSVISGYRYVARDTWLMGVIVG